MPPISSTSSIPSADNYQNPQFWVSLAESFDTSSRFEAGDFLRGSTTINPTLVLPQTLSPSQKAVLVKIQSCLRHVSHLSPLVNTIETALAKPSSYTRTTQGFFTQNNTIFNTATQPITLHGVNWFGFETTDYAPHGLHNRDYKKLITQVKSLGFNSLRLPFSPAIFNNANKPNIRTDTINQDLAGKTGLQVLDAIMAECARQNIYIVLDHHQINPNGPIPELWYEGNYSEAQWIADLKFVAARYKTNPFFIGLDLKNEPHGRATIGGSGTTDWLAAVNKAGAAVLQANPNLLLFVEGIEQQAQGLWWGGNVGPFTTSSFSSIPVSKIVLSPHTFGPSVHEQPYFKGIVYPTKSTPMWDSDFGSSIDEGFTVAPGEFGAWVADPYNKRWQEAYVSYLLHRGIQNYFYFSLNPESANTMGVLEHDWKTPNQLVLNSLAPIQ